MSGCEGYDAIAGVYDRLNRDKQTFYRNNLPCSTISSKTT